MTDNFFIIKFLMRILISSRRKRLLLIKHSRPPTHGQGTRNFMLLQEKFFRKLYVQGHM